MSLGEKALLLTGDSAWTTAAVPRVGIQSIRMADGPHGVRRTARSDSMAFEASAATAFPTASCTGATWEPELLREMGAAIAREAIALDVDIVLGPGVNMKRSPLCGRNFEYFSEDPFLAGHLAAAWIDGIQSHGVGASLKHFAVNNQETRRMSMSAQVDERTLRETYLRAFQIAIEAAQPWTVMCSYNRINGTYASEHRALLTDILRNEFGFDGFVVSDWAAVHDRPAAVAAGLDLEMPGPRPRRVQSVVDAVSSGALDETVVDTSVLRILGVIEHANATPKGGTFDAAAHHALARRIAGEGMVLLKNDGTLPLQREGRIAVIGRAAVEPRIQGGGSSHITPTSIDEPLAELRRLAGTAEVEYVAGYDADGSGRPEQIREAVELASESDVAVIYASLPVSKESEGFDRTDIDLTDQQIALTGAISMVQPKTVVVLSNGSAVACASWLGDVAAVLEAWYAGQATGGAIADILFGDVDPSGRLAETFPVRLEDTPAYLDFPGDRDTVRYSEGNFIGYRWYDARRIPVTFPFGHGLSYTTFEYGPAELSSSSIDAGQPVTVRVRVGNRGDRAGREVVQVYVRDVAASVQRPDKELAGFAKVSLEPGETREVAIVLDPGAFSFWDPDLSRWVIEPGRFDVLVGSSSADIHTTASIVVVPSSDDASHLSEMSPLDDWLHDPSVGSSATKLLRALAPLLGATFGDANLDIDQPDPHFSYFLAMPMRTLLEFASPSGGPDPDDTLAALLAAARDRTQPDHETDDAEPSARRVAERLP